MKTVRGWKIRDDTDFTYDGNWWYDLKEEYIKPSDFIADTEQLQELNDAIDLVKSFEGLFDFY